MTLNLAKLRAGMSPDCLALQKGPMGIGTPAPKRHRGPKPARMVRTCVERNAEHEITRATYPIQVVSEPNMRGHWRRGAKRARAQRTAVFVLLYGEKLPAPPVDVLLERMGGKMLDKDNLQAAFKHVRDEIAAKLGVNDGDDSKARWRYGQNPGGKVGIRVTVTPMRPNAA